MKLLTKDSRWDGTRGFLSLVGRRNPYLRVAATTAATLRDVRGEDRYIGSVEGAALRKLGEAIVKATRPRAKRTTR